MAWKLTNWPLRTHCYRGGLLGVWRTKLPNSWKKEATIHSKWMQRTLMFHCVQSQLSQNTDLFWPCQLGCIPEPSLLPVSDAAPLQPHTKVKMLLELLQISFPGYILCSFKVFKASFKNAASCSQMAAWIYDDWKELVILRKKRFNNCNGEKKNYFSAS